MTGTLLTDECGRLPVALSPADTGRFSTTTVDVHNLIGYPSNLKLGDWVRFDIRLDGHGIKNLRKA